MITRWHSDVTRDHWGSFIYLHDPRSGELWSATYQPTLVQPDSYEVTFAIDKAEYHRRQGDIETILEVTISPECDAEVRQLRIVNHGSQTRQLQITSFSEIVLNTQAADAAHPAFQKLFIETEYVAEENSIIARRRPRSADQEALYAVHTLSGIREDQTAVEFDTSRLTFLGRNRSAENPLGATAEHLSGSIGAVLDPICALRATITLGPEDAISLGFTTGIATSREQALALADQFHDQRGTQRAFELAWAFAQAEARHNQVDGAQLHLYQRLGSALLYPDVSLRAPRETLAKNQLTQPALWRFGISGDLPIITCHINDTDQLPLVAELLLAHRFLVEHGLACDMVILNDYPGSYFDAVQDQLLTMINEHPMTDRRKGAVHLLRGAQLPLEDRVLVACVAAVVLYGNQGDLQTQMNQAAARLAKLMKRLVLHSTSLPSSHLSASATRAESNESIKYFATNKPLMHRKADVQPVDPAREFDGGLGGFVKSGRAYQISLTSHSHTPAPWSNVISNARLGCCVTESGGGNTWFENSRENKLTEWSNDPVSDSPSEMLYLEDRQSNSVWSPMAYQQTRVDEYRCQHGFGYSLFEHTSHGIQQEVLISVAADDPVKILRVRLHNMREDACSLSLTYYVEWVLGVVRAQTSKHIHTSIDSESQALIARNRYSTEFANQLAFLYVPGRTVKACGDRTLFIGRNGTLRFPQGLSSQHWDDSVGNGYDPCGAVQTEVQIEPGATEEVVLLLGAARDESELQTLLSRYNDPAVATSEIHKALKSWSKTLGALEVRTPNRALDILVNGWLQYQTLSCRLWGRSAFYQSGGAFGFRDQLQDVMALVWNRPELAREQILTAASRQFIEGDVQHWWHPPVARELAHVFPMTFCSCHLLSATTSNRQTTRRSWMKQSISYPHLRCMTTSKSDMNNRKSRIIPLRSTNTASKPSSMPSAMVAMDCR